jgi:hypothetical protein
MHNDLKRDHSDALPLALGPAREASSRRAVARSVQDRSDVLEFNKCEVGRDAYPSSGHTTAAHTRAGIGLVVVTSIWLAFHVVAAVHSLAFDN